MSPSRPDRALRRLVANLAAEASDGIRAILAELEPGERARVERLLGEYLGSSEATSSDRAAAPPPPLLRPAGVSPNLLARLDDEAAFAITPLARQALREAAAAMNPAPLSGRGPQSVFEAWRGRLLRGSAA